MSEEWRRIQGFRGVSRLRVTVTSDAEIELRVRQSMQEHIHISAGETRELPVLFLDPFSLWLKSDDPNCQCQIQAEYTEDLTDVVHGITISPVVDMRFLYGPMGLGIPAFSGLVGDASLFAPQVHFQPQPPIPEQQRVKPEKPQIQETEKPCPGITRLQAFKRELEEEKPKEKEKHKFLSKLKGKRGEKEK